MNINDLNTIEQLEQFLTGSQAVAFLVASSQDECYQGIQRILVKFRYAAQKKYSKGIVVRIWTPPVLQAKITFGLWVRLHTYIRPVNELKGSGHNGLFARLLLIAFTCSMAQRTVQVLQTPVRPVHH